MIIFKKTIKHVSRLKNLFIYLTLFWVLFALTADIILLTLHISGQKNLAQKIDNELIWLLDDTFHSK